MQNTTGSTTYPSGSTTGLNGGDGTLGRAGSAAHSGIDASAAGAHNLAAKARPVIDRVASSAHQAVDKAVNVALPTAEWLSTKGENLKVTQERFIADARTYVTANPLKAVGMALAAGLLIGRLMR